MDSAKISMPTSNNDPLLLKHHSSSTRRNHNSTRQFIIVLILCFTLILAAIIYTVALLKHQIDSKSPAKNPALAIQSFCSPYPYYDDDYCFRILSPLQNSSQISPTQIFALAVRSAMDSFAQLTPLPESTRSRCEIPFNDTLSQLSIASTTLGAGVDSRADVRNLTAWLSDEGFMVKSCLDGLLERPEEIESDGLWTAEMKLKMYESTMFASSSLEILSHADMISETLNPTIKSTLTSFMSGWDNVLLVSVFGLQYLFLLLLFCIFFRLY